MGDWTAQQAYSVYLAGLLSSCLPSAMPCRRSRAHQLISIYVAAVVHVQLRKCALHNPLLLRHILLEFLPAAVQPLYLSLMTMACDKDALKPSINKLP